MFYHLPEDEGGADGPVVSWVLLAALFEDWCDGDFPPEVRHLSWRITFPDLWAVLPVPEAEQKFPLARAGAFRTHNEIIWWLISNTIIRCIDIIQVALYSWWNDEGRL